MSFGSITHFVFSPCNKILSKRKLNCKSRLIYWLNATVWGLCHCIFHLLSFWPALLLHYEVRHVTVKENFSRQLEKTHSICYEFHLKKNVIAFSSLGCNGWARVKRKRTKSGQRLLPTMFFDSGHLQHESRRRYMEWKSMNSDKGQLNEWSGWWHKYTKGASCVFNNVLYVTRAKSQEHKYRSRYRSKWFCSHLLYTAHLSSSRLTDKWAIRRRWVTIVNPLAKCQRDVGAYLHCEELKICRAYGIMKPAG